MGEPLKAFQKGAGCTYCHGTGYLGRTGVFELLIVNNEIRQMFSAGASSSEIKSAAIKAGMLSMLKDGLIKVHAMGPEKEQILDVIKGPSYIGIPTTVGAKTNHYSATAISDTTVCFISFDVFKEFVTQNGEFAYEIIVELSKNELRSYKKCINQVQKHSAGKIAEALLHFSKVIFNKDKFIIPLTRNELGDLTCSTRETVSRILSDFSNNKIIKLNKNNITILDKNKLEIISQKG